MGRGVKALVESLLVFLLLVGCVVKANTFSLIYFLCIVPMEYCTKHSTRKMLQFVVLVSILLGI